MSIPGKILVATIGTAVLFGALAAHAQDGAAAPPAAAAPQDEPYQPSLSDIMAQQQERHIKLWFAGHAGNWPLADYEIGELSDGFDAVSKMLGGDLIKQHVGGPLDALQKAVDSKDSAAFAAAFDQPQRRLQCLPPRARSCFHRDRSVRPRCLTAIRSFRRRSDCALTPALYKGARHRARRQAAKVSRESFAYARPWHARLAPPCCSRLRGQ